MAKKSEQVEVKQEQTLDVTSVRFVKAVEQQFAAEMGSRLKFTDYEKTLAQHLFLKADMALKAIEAKRKSNDDRASITWSNVNMQKLALDAVNRVSLGLDALLPNHIHVIPYWNKRAGKYDLDLRVGYTGHDFCRRKLALHPVADIRYELVREEDHFVPLMRSHDRDVESYEFAIKNAWTRGDVIGAFGYIMYEDPQLNRLVLVTDRDFRKAEAAAMTKDFWGDAKWRDEMKMKTTVLRTASKISLDPSKVNAPAYVEIQSQDTELVQGTIEPLQLPAANSEVIDVSESTRAIEPTPETQPEVAPEPETMVRGEFGGCVPESDPRAQKASEEETSSEKPSTTGDESPSSPAARFGDMCVDRELSTTKARKLLADLIPNVESVQQLKFEHYDRALANIDWFVTRYKAEYDGDKYKLPEEPERFTESLPIDEA